MNKETRAFIAEHLTDNLTELSLRATAADGVDVKFALAQLKARQSIRRKMPEWYGNLRLEMPAQLSTEQSSSQETATFKKTFFPQKRGVLVDLTGGMGIDCYYLSQQFGWTFYVERNAELCRVASHNFAELGRADIEVVNDSAENFLEKLPSADCLYIDPARRDENGRKVFFLSDCTPDVVKMRRAMLEKSPVVLLKLSPMLDLKNAVSSLENVSEVFVVSLENECKELLLKMERSASADVRITAVNLQKNGNQMFTFLQSEEENAACATTDVLQNFLYEPNASAMKAGAYKVLAGRFAVRKLHPNTHLYTSATLVGDFPGRTFRIESAFSFSKKDLRTGLSGIEKANLSVRNFPESVDALRKKLKLKDGGDVYLFATTVGADSRRMLLLCRKI